MDLIDTAFDGVHDNTPAFRAALAAMPNGGILNLPDHGIIRLTGSVTISTPGISIRGAYPSNFPLVSPSTHAALNGTWIFLDFTSSTASEGILIEAAGTTLDGMGFIDRQTMPVRGVFTAHHDNPWPIRTYRGPGSNSGAIVPNLRNLMFWGTSYGIFSDGAAGLEVDTLQGEVFRTLVKIREQYGFCNIRNIRMEADWSAAAGIDNDYRNIVTIGAGDPTTVFWPGHGFSPGAAIRFEEGVIPPEITRYASYIVSAENLSPDSFQFSANPGGPSITTTGPWVGCWCNADSFNAVTNYKFVNLVLFNLERCDRPIISNVVAFGANTGLIFNDGPTGSCDQFQFSSWQLDNCVSGIVFNSAGARGQMANMALSGSARGAAITGGLSFGIGSMACSSFGYADIINFRPQDVDHAMLIDDNHHAGQGNTFNIGNIFAESYDNRNQGRAAITVIGPESRVNLFGGERYNPLSPSTAGRWAGNVGRV